MAVMLAAAMTSAACGARWTEEQKQAIVARPDAQTTTDGRNESAASTPGQAAPLPGTASGHPAAPASPEDAASAHAQGATPAGTDPTAIAATQGATGGPRPCAEPSDAPGISDFAIDVAEISSITGPVSGLGASAAAAARAYVAYRNATGGLCGRELRLREADDGSDAGRYRSLLTELNRDAFALTGGFALGDVGGTDLIQQFGIPVVNAPTGTSGEEAPTAFDINPPYESDQVVQEKYQYLRSQGATKVALTVLAVDQSRREAMLQRSLMEAAGLHVVLFNELPVSTLSYDSAARQVANSGADYSWFSGDTNGAASMARSMADVDHDVEIQEYAYTAYATPFIELAGDAAEGTTAWIRSLPVEEAASSPPLQTMVEWMARVAPDEPVDLFAIDSWVSMIAFGNALEQLTGSITRDAVVAQLAGVQTFDAGGMFGPIRLGAEISDGCVVGARVVGGRWERMAPPVGFLC